MTQERSDSSRNANLKTLDRGNRILIQVDEANSTATITVHGQLSCYLEGLARYIGKGYGIRQALAQQTESTITVGWQLTEGDKDPMSGSRNLRYVWRIRDQCRKYVLDVTGHPDGSPESDYHVVVIDRSQEPHSWYN